MNNFIKKSLLLILATTALTATALSMVEEKVQTMGQELFNATHKNNLKQIKEITFAIYKLFPQNPPNAEKSKLVLKILNTRGFYNLTPLILATLSNNYLIVRALLAIAGVYLNESDFEEFVNAKDKANLTALDITKIKINTWKNYTIKEIIDIYKLLRQAIEWNNTRPCKSQTMNLVQPQQVIFMSAPNINNPTQQPNDYE